jgi:hypothetical protein
MWLLVSALGDTLAIEVSGDETIDEFRSILGTDYGFGTDFILAYRADAFSARDPRTIRSAGLTDMTLLTLQQPNSINRPPQSDRMIFSPAPPVRAARRPELMLVPETLILNTKLPGSSRSRRAPSAVVPASSAVPASPPDTPESTATATQNVMPAPPRAERSTRCCTVA